AVLPRAPARRRAARGLDDPQRTRRSGFGRRALGQRPTGSRGARSVESVLALLRDGRGGARDGRRSVDLRRREIPRAPLASRATALWIEADKPGVYKGQCSEFCGQGHADMLITIVAHPKAEYAAWAKSAVDQWNAANGPEVAKGRETFLANACVGCHTIQGTT